MSYLDVSSGEVVSHLGAEQRAGFIRRTYFHVAMSIVAFVVLESLLISTGWGETILSILAINKYSWLLVMGAFMLASTVADNWARSDVSREMQYMGLGLYIGALALLFLPLMTVAINMAPEVLPKAALTTAALVAGLTAVVMVTRKNFSFLRSAVVIGSFVAIGIIVAATMFEIALGTFFSAAMIIFASICILYTTSNILHEYHEEQHVAAALSLFASIGLVFWYMVQFFMSFGSD